MITPGPMVRIIETAEGSSIPIDAWERDRTKTKEEMACKGCDLCREKGESR